MHSVVSGFINGKGSLLDLLRACPEPRGPLVSAMLLLREAYGEGRGCEEAISSAAAVAEESLDDPDLCIIFLGLWISLALDLRRLGEAQALVNRRKALVTGSTPPELAADVVAVEGLVASSRGAKDERDRAFRRALKIVPLDSGRRRIVVWDWAIFLAQHGRLAEVRDDVEWLEQQCDDDFPLSRLAPLRLFNATETGHLDNVETWLARIRSDPLLKHWGRGGFKLVEETAHLMSGTLKPDMKAQSEWVRSTQYLLDGNTEEALLWARRYSARYPNILYGHGFVSLCLLRAELAAGNAGAALRLLAQKRLKGSRHYLDDLSFARAELLTGNREAAAGHFGKALKACERYGARKRVDFELRLARELSPADVLELVRGPVTPPPRAKEIPHEVRATTDLNGISRLMGSSRGIRSVREMVLRLAPTDAAVLIVGETGTGKELVSRALHEEGPRNSEPFIAVNCGAIAETLLESELFGHERGAFTGASRARRGFFEEAGRGTLLLDEIGEISQRLQLALLRVLETREVRPVGSTRSRKTACRVLAATNTPLDALVEKGLFRKDLYYRLQRMEISIPPLRERPGDIVALAAHFLGEGRPAGERVALSTELKRVLRTHDWPGNVRELRNETERMRLLGSDKLAYDIANLSPAVAGGGRSEPASGAEPIEGPVASGPVPFRKGRSYMRRLDQLRECFRSHGKLTRAEIAKMLGVSPGTATRYLKTLCGENFVTKIRPSASPSTHYFQLEQ